jgi:hypothetical protein
LVPKKTGYTQFRIIPNVFAGRRQLSLMELHGIYEAVRRLWTAQTRVAEYILPPKYTRRVEGKGIRK